MRRAALAHQQGLIHCDIKPSNIMTHHNGTSTDFGLAHMTETAATSALLLGGGTFGYMSPEQARGESQPRRPISTRWALSCMKC
jgi:serine/threonine protein kinase